MEITDHEISKDKKSKKDNVFIKLWQNMKDNYELYLLSIPAFIFFVVFHYFPMYGVQIAFRDFMATKGFLGSPWVGFEHFERFFNSYHFWTLMKNTLGISIYQLVVGFPLPIILALMLNEVRQKHFKKTVQMVTYAPHFISTVVMVGMIVVFLDPRTGYVNKLLVLMGFDAVNFMGEPEMFKSIYVFTNVWQRLGFNSVIYIAALAGIDQAQLEAATIDGATKMQKIWYVNIPGIMPTIIILLIMSVGQIMNVGFEKVFLMQNGANKPASDIIATYVYRAGLLDAQYSFSAAVGLFNSAINCILLFTVNAFARKFSDSSLW